MFSKSIWRNFTKNANPSSQSQNLKDDNISVSSETKAPSNGTAAFSYEASDPSRRNNASSIFRFLRRRQHSIPKRQQLEQKYDRRLDPQGLTIKFTPSCPPSADIIFIHGLGGSSCLSWSKNGNPDLFWPQKWLPLDEDIKSARIWSFGYDAQFMSQQRKGVLSISDFAKDLLFQMQYPPDGIDKTLPLGKCPIIFVTHSMGGLVFKKAFLYGQTDELYKPVIDSIRAVVFLSTPHRGTNFADYLNKLLSASMFYSSQQYISELARNSPFIEEINEQFRNVAPRLQIFSFYETRETEIGGRGVMILRKDTSVLGYPGEVSKPLDANHHEVCKFDSTEDINYKSVCAVLRQLICTCLDKGIEPTQENTEEENKLISSYFAASHSAAEHDLGFFWGRRSPDTCTWVIETETYKEWEESIPQSAIMWLHAQPGRGKSILSSYVIHRLLEQGAAVQYYFFRFSDKTKQSIGSLLKSLAVQLSRNFPAFRRALMGLKRSGFNPHDSNGQSIWQEVFVSLLFKLHLTTPIYWVIDGIDESESPEILATMLRSISSSHTSIRVLLVSRWSTRLSASFKKLSSNIKSFTLCADDASTGFSSDIFLYTAEELSYLPWSIDLQREVVQKVTDNANGSFLWVHFVVEEFKDCHTMDNIITVLNDLPKGMEALYRRMELSISKNKRGSDTALQRTLFIWALYTRDAVATGEMLQALKPEWPLFDLSFTINRLCGHFLIIEGDNCIRLIHETARDYLLSKSTLPFSLEPHQAHYDILNKAIAAFADPGSGVTHNPDEDHTVLLYRATSWVYHLNNTSFTEPCLSLLTQFFNSKGVLIWIHALSSLDHLRSLITSSRQLRICIDGISDNYMENIPQGDRSANLKMVHGWTQDLLKLAAKFGSYLIQKPTAIYGCVPPLCPPDSHIFRTFQNMYRSSLKVRGVSEGWDDCLARVSLSSENQATNLACSRRYLAVVNSAGAISLWDVQTFQPVRELLHEEYVQSVCFSRTGGFIASYAIETTKVWNSHSGELVLSTSNIADLEILELAFTEDETILLAASDSRGVFSMPMLGKTKTWKSLGDLVVDDCHKVNGMYSNCPSALAFNFDQTKIAATFRRFPLILWSVGRPKSFKRLVRSGTNRQSPRELTNCVILAQWHPNNEEILGVFADGCIFKWNINSNAQYEFKSTRIASDIQCSPDGKVFATSDASGTIYFYDYQSLSWIYQLPSEGIVGDLCFSHDSTRLYDIRDNYCNIWELNALNMLSARDNYPNKLEPDLNITSQLNESVSETITMICSAGNGAVVCSSYDNGIVKMHEYTTGLKKYLGKCPMNLSVEFMAWSQNCDRFVYAENGDKLNLFSLKGSNGGQSSRLWDHKLLKRFKVEREIGGIEQILLSPDGLLLLVVFKLNAQLWCTQTYTRISSALDARGYGRRWIEHPLRRDQLLSINLDTISCHKWEDLSELRRWNIAPIQGDSPAEKKRDSPELTSPVEVEEDLLNVLLTHSRRHMVLTISRKTTRSRSLRPRHAIIQLSTLLDRSDRKSRSSNMVTDIVQQIWIPEEISTQIEEILNIFEPGHLIFVDQSLWINSWSIDSKDNVARPQIKRHFFLPRDWVTRESIRLLHLDENGTVLCPKKGELIVIESSLKSDILN